MFKRLMLAYCVSVAAAGWSFANLSFSSDQIPYRYIYLSDISKDEVQQLLNEPHAHDVLVCPEGTRLPVRFSLKGDLIELDASNEGAYHLIVKQTFYLRIANEQVLISLDGTQWKAWDALLTGMVSATLTHAQNSPLLELSGEAHFRS